MKIKICGITNEDDANYALKKGADIIGVILDFGIKRHGTEDLIEKIKEDHPDALLTGVYTSLPSIAGKEDYVQLHFRHSQEDIIYVRKVLGKKVISVIDFHEENIREKAKLHLDAGADYVLLEDRKGIIGRKNELMEMPMGGIGIAGKIDSENLQSLLQLNPDLIDVSSSLEETIGKKSFKKIDEFFNIVGEYSVIR